MQKRGLRAAEGTPTSKSKEYHSKVGDWLAEASGVEWPRFEFCIAPPDATEYGSHPRKVVAGYT